MCRFAQIDSAEAELLTAGAEQGIAEKGCRDALGVETGEVALALIGMVMNGAGQPLFADTSFTQQGYWQSRTRRQTCLLLRAVENGGGGGVGAVENGGAQACISAK